MSANNYILIAKKDGHFSITECDADTNKTILQIGDANSPEEAMEMAQGYCEDPDNEVEYGIRYIK